MLLCRTRVRVNAVVGPSSVAGGCGFLFRNSHLGADCRAASGVSLGTAVSTLENGFCGS